MNIPPRSSLYEELRQDRLIRTSVKIAIVVFVFTVIIPWIVAIVEGQRILALEESAERQTAQLINIAAYNGGHD